jgi:hypothetical protein
MSISAVVAIAAGASALAAVVNLVIAATLARTARRNAIGSVFTWAADLLSRDTVVRARKDIFQNLKSHHERDGTYENMDESLKESFEIACRTYDLVGIAGHNGLLPRNIIAAEWGDSIIRLHELCEPYLHELRRTRGPDFWDNFSQLYAESIRMRKTSLRQRRAFVT